MEKGYGETTNSYRGSKIKADGAVESLGSCYSNTSSSSSSSSSETEVVYNDASAFSAPKLHVSSASHRSLDQPFLSSEVIPIDVPAIQPKGTISASIMNLANTILGAGLLAMPAALAHVGLIPGMFFIVFSGFISAFGLRLLTDCAAVVGRTSSFTSLSLLTFPKAALFFDIAIAIKCFGVSVSYLVIVGDLIPQIVLGVSPDVSDDSVLLQRWFWITAALTLVSPLTFLRSLSALRFTSYIALSAATYLVLLVIYFSLFPDPSIVKPTPEDLPYFNFGYEWFTTVPIFVFAFTCHQNIFAIYNELVNNTESRIRRVINSAIGASMGFYEIVGVIGFFAFGKTVKSNIIAMYPTSPAVILGQVAILLLVILSYPLQCHPCRISLDKIIVQSRAQRSEVKSETPLMPRSRTLGAEVVPGSLKHPKTAISDRIPNGRFILLTVSIIVSSYLVSVSVKELSLVLALVGATGSTTICYILPGLFYYKMFKQGLVGHSKLPPGIDNNLIIEPYPAERRVSINLGIQSNSATNGGLSMNVEPQSKYYSSTQSSLQTNEKDSTGLLIDTRDESGSLTPLRSLPASRTVYIGSILLMGWGFLVMFVSLTTQLIKIFG